MKRVHIAVLLVLAASATVGLGVLLLHVEGIALLAQGSVVSIGIIVAVILAVGGFFVGALYRPHGAEEAPDRTVVRRLSEALSLERRLRIEASHERYKLKQTVSSLEGRVLSLNAQPLPPAERAEAPSAAKGVASTGEIEELATTCEKLRRELLQRKERMADLEAELSVAQAEADDLRSRTGAEGQRTEGARGAGPGAVAFRGESLTAVLDDLVAQEGVHVALVADDQGLVVDAAGEVLEPDALAAVSCVVAELGPRVTDLLPLGEIVTVGLGDAAGRMMEVRYFPLLGSRCALAVIRDEGVSTGELVRRAADAIAERLSR
jgi:predicted regulator of Ras-like GTPase activity (Roadblock/LC7/MglB family)